MAPTDRSDFSAVFLGRRRSRGIVRPALRHAPRVLAAPRAVAAELIETMRQVDIVAAKPALRQDRGDVGGALALALRRGVHHHAGEPRRQRQSAKLAALVGDAALRVDRAKLDQQRLRFGERAGGRRIEERERRGIGRAPLRQIEQQARQIGGEDFRPRIGFERRGLRLVPQPIADAGLGAAGAAAALIGGGARHAHGFQAGDADVGLVARHARKPAVDDDAHALDGERGFGNRGREHHLALALGRGRNRAILGLRVERAVKRHHVDRGIVDPLLQQRFGAADFRLPRQEHQRRARLGAQRARHRIGDLALDGLAGVAAEIARLDRQTPGLRFRPPAHRREALRRARRRASPTSPEA